MAGRGHEEYFLDTGNVLSLDLGGRYIRVVIFEKNSKNRLSVYSKSPTYKPSSCELSKMRTCIHVSSHVS